MKHNHDHDNVHPGITHPVTVRFEFDDPTAVSVSVAGTFNQWRPEAKRLHRVGDGHWLIEMGLVPGAYEYRFVVDGVWMADPLSPETVQNPFGGRNSVFKVACSTPVEQGTAHQDALSKQSNQHQN